MKAVDYLRRPLGGLARISVATILLLPVVVTAIISFDARNFLGPLPPKSFSLHWYTAFFASDIYGPALGWSALVTLSAVFLGTFLALLAASALNRFSFPGRSALLSLFLAPLIIPHIVLGFGLLMAFASVRLDNSFVRLALGHTLLILPLSIRLILAGMEGLSRSITEAAATLGATPLRTFLEITLPLARPSIVASIVFATSASFGEVTMSVFLTDQNVRTFPVALLGEIVSNTDLTIAAASVILMAATLVLVLLVDWLFGLERVIGLRRA